MILTMRPSEAVPERPALGLAARESSEQEAGVERSQQQREGRAAP